MSIETHVHRARDRAQAEREATTAKVDAFETFLSRVEDLPTGSIPSPSPGMLASGGTQFKGQTSTRDRCQAVRTTFEETIHPHSVADVDGSEPLLATIREEFTDSIAVALAPTTEPSFTPDLKRAVLSEATARHAESRALHRALGREVEILEDAIEVVDEVTTWIADADETPLTELGFDALQDRHRTLSIHRDHCEDLVRERQAFLRKTTSENGTAGLRHRQLISYLYPDFPADYPVLSTVARLDATCTDCQRAVRDHLVRRV